MENKNTSVAAKIKELRIAKGLSQSDLAKEITLTIAAYNRLENAKTQITVSVLFAIAEVLDQPVSRLLDLPEANSVTNKHSMVMANFNNGSLNVSISGEELRKLSNMDISQIKKDSM